AVRVLADMADLKPVALDGVLYVTSKPNAEVLQAEQEKLRVLKAEREKEDKKASGEPQTRRGEASRRSEALESGTFPNDLTTKRTAPRTPVGAQWPDLSSEALFQLQST